MPRDSLGLIHSILRWRIVVYVVIVIALGVWMLHRQSTLRDKKPDVQDQEKGAPKDEKTIPLPVPLRKDAPPEAKGGEVAVDLAKEKDGEAAKAIRISIKIDADDKDRPLIAIDGESMSGWDAVRAKLEALAGAPERGTIPVVIAADKDVWHKWVMSCLDILQQLGYTKISFKH